jgi:hypothetical protein
MIDVRALVKMIGCSGIMCRSEASNPDVENSAACSW